LKRAADTGEGLRVNLIKGGAKYEGERVALPCKITNYEPYSHVKMYAKRNGIWPLHVPAKPAGGVVMLRHVCL
jgi:hypothetical protein